MWGVACVCVCVRARKGIDFSPSFCVIMEQENIGSGAQRKEHAINDGRTTKKTTKTKNMCGRSCSFLVEVIPYCICLSLSVVALFYGYPSLERILHERLTEAQFCVAILMGVYDVVSFCAAVAAVLLLMCAKEDSVDESTDGVREVVLVVLVATFAGGMMLNMGEAISWSNVQVTTQNNNNIIINDMMMMMMIRSNSSPSSPSPLMPLEVNVTQTQKIGLTVIASIGVGEIVSSFMYAVALYVLPRPSTLSIVSKLIRIACHVVASNNLCWLLVDCATSFRDVTLQAPTMLLRLYVVRFTFILWLKDTQITCCRRRRGGRGGKSEKQALMNSSDSENALFKKSKGTTEDKEEGVDVVDDDDDDMEKGERKKSSSSSSSFSVSWPWLDGSGMIIDNTTYNNANIKQSRSIFVGAVVGAVAASMCIYFSIFDVTVRKGDDV